MKNELIPKDSYIKWVLKDGEAIESNTKQERKLQLNDIATKTEDGDYQFNIKTFDVITVTSG